MLTLSRKSGYAIIALSYLQENNDNVISAKRIAEVFNMPLRLTMNILKQLHRAGVVESERGVNGGYRLKMNPEDITLKFIINIIEGSTNLASCASIKKTGKKCDIISKCPIRGPIFQIQQRFEEFLDNITLAEIVDRNKVNSLIESGGRCGKWKAK